MIHTGVQQTVDRSRQQVGTLLGPSDLTRRALRFCAVAFVIARLAVSLLGLAVGSLTTNPLPLDPGTSAPATAGWHNLWDGTDRLDAAWFETIADRGYDFDRNAAAFFPLYPVLVRSLSAVPGIGTFAAATLISNLALLLALVLLYVLTTRELSESDARRTTVLLLAFPRPSSSSRPTVNRSSCSWPSSHSRRRDRVAGPRPARLGIAAAATRSIGLILAPSLAWEAWTRPPGRERTRGLIAAAVVVVGTLLYLGWWQVHVGDALRPLEVQAHWKRTIQFPFVTLARGLYQAIHVIGAPDGGYWISDAVLSCVAIGGVIAIWRRAAPSWCVWSARTRRSVVLPLSGARSDLDVTFRARRVSSVLGHGALDQTAGGAGNLADHFDPGGALARTAVHALPTHLLSDGQPVETGGGRERVHGRGDVLPSLFDPSQSACPR